MILDRWELPSIKLGSEQKKFYKIENLICGKCFQLVHINVNYKPNKIKICGCKCDNERLEEIDKEISDICDRYKPRQAFLTSNGDSQKYWKLKEEQEGLE